MACLKCLIVSVGFELCRSTLVEIPVSSGVEKDSLLICATPSLLTHTVWPYLSPLDCRKAGFAAAYILHCLCVSGKAGDPEEGIT